MLYFGSCEQDPPWRDLPPDLGHWSNTHRRFIRWRDKGVWEKLMEILMDSPDYEWLMIDASHCKVHPPASGTVGGNTGHEPYQRGRNTKLHLAVDAHGMPVRFALTEGTTADCKQAVALIEGLDAEHPLADKDYDTNEIVDYAQEHSIDLVVPPKKNRIHQRTYDKDLYKLRHLVENAFLNL